MDKSAKTGDIFKKNAHPRTSIPKAMPNAPIICKGLRPNLSTVKIASVVKDGFSYWIYGVISILAAIFMIKFVPETKGKSLEELESIWK